MFRFDKNGNLTINEMVELVQAWDENIAVDSERAMDAGYAFDSDGPGTDFISYLLDSDYTLASPNRVSIGRFGLIVNEIIETESDPVYPNRIAQIDQLGRLKIIGEIREV